MDGGLNVKFNVFHTIFEMFKLLLLLLLLLLLSFQFVYLCIFHAAFAMGPETLSRHVNKLNCVICDHCTLAETNKHTHIYTDQSLYIIRILVLVFYMQGMYKTLSQDQTPRILKQPVTLQMEQIDKIKL